MNHAGSRVAFPLVVKTSRIWGIRSILVESSAVTIALALHPDSSAIGDGSPQNPLNWRWKAGHVCSVLCSYCSEGSFAGCC